MTLLIPLLILAWFAVMIIAFLEDIDNCIHEAELDELWDEDDLAESA